MARRWCKIEPGGCGISITSFHLLQLALSIPLALTAALPKGIDVSIPPILEVGPPKGELLFHVVHDPEKSPENLTIPCVADALPMPSYSWFKNGDHFNTDVDGVSMVDGEGTIVFPDPQQEDEGDYQCVATNSAGSVYSDIVNVRRAITISFPKGEPRVVTAVLGEPLALKCENPGGYPIPSLHWVLQRSDGSLRSVSSTRATVDEDGTLWFGSVAFEDASEDALYACAASSATSEREVFVVEEEGIVTLEGAQPEEGSFVSITFPTEYRMGNWVYLNVTLPPRDPTIPEPRVEPFLQHVSKGTQTVLAGEDVKLFCIYGGNPIPQVRWWREDGKAIPAEGIVEFGKALQLSEIADDLDDVTFYCEARSDIGAGAIHSFSINVESVPEFIETPTTINQPIGEQATFKCSAKGDPTPVITWSVNGEPLDEKQDTLTFDSLTNNDKGVIACNASNAHGYVYATGFLNVLSLPPEFTTQPDDATGLEGESITLPCESYGAPDPIMRWVKESDSDSDETPIEDGDVYSVSDKSLVIKSLSDETSGTYICTAVNKYGKVSTSVSVKLILSTVVDVHSSSTVIKAGDTVTIFCDVTADETLTADVTWLKDDNSLDFSDPRITSENTDSDATESYSKVLKIQNSQGADSGVYSCVSKTMQDEAEDFIIITVEDVPEMPEITEVECSTREAYIHWVPNGENSSPIIGYTIQTQTELHKDKWEEAHNDIPASNTSLTVKLTPGLTHVFRVIAVNRVGESDPSTPSNQCVAAGAPPDYNPLNTTFEIIDSSTIQISWEAMEPKEHNGPDFRYEVSWKRSDEDDGDDNSDEEVDITFVEDVDHDNGWSKLVIEDWEQTDVEIDGLRPHTQYRVSVAAVNEHGAGPTPEEMLIFTEAAVPLVSPRFLRVRRITDTSAILFWVPVPLTQVFGPLKGYEVDIWKAGDVIQDDVESDDDLIALGQTSRADLTGLEPYTKYKARVRVLNERFAGPYTDTIKFRTAQGDSSPVIDLQARSLSENSLLIEWGAPTHPRGVVTNYVIRYEPIYEDDIGIVMETITGVTEPQVKLPDLEENTLYKVTVLPRSGGGLGEPSTVEARTEKTEASIPVPPVFSWDVIEAASTTTSKSVLDRDDDGDIDDDDVRLQNVIIADTDGDGDVDEDDVLDTDNDGDIDEDDVDVADINNDGKVDENDVIAADRDGDGDVDEYDIGDEDGDGDFDADDVLIADEDGDGDIDDADDNEENVILQDIDGDGDIDEDDAIDVDGDGDIDDTDLSILDVDDDGDIDEDDVKLADKDDDGDIDAADIIDLDEDGRIDEDDFDVRDIDNDGDIDRSDYVYRSTFVGDTDGDGDVDSDDVIDIDGDGDVDKDDFYVADINNDGVVDESDVKAGDRDGDGDVDANDIGDEDGDGDIDGTDVILADVDNDGDIDADDDDEEDTLLEDRDQDGDIDEDDVTDVDGDGDVDEDDISIFDVDDDGDIDADDLAVIDKDGDGDVDRADVVDFNGDGKIDEYDLEIVDRDGDGDIDAKDIANRHTYLKDTDNDGDIDFDDVIDVDRDGDVDQYDVAASDLDDDGDVDIDDLMKYDKDGDGDIDYDDISDLDGDGIIDEDDFDVTDRDGDGDVDERDFLLRNIFLTDVDKDGDVDRYDVLDTDGDGDIDEEDFDVADINNDGKVDEKDVIAGDVDGDGDVDISDIGDEDGDGDIDGDDVELADEDGDGDIDAEDDDGEFILLVDKDEDGDIDLHDVGDVDGDGDIDQDDIDALDIDNDGDVDEEDLKRGDKDGDGDIDAADITDLDGDGDIDGNDIIISDRDGDGDIDASDRRNKDVILGDADGDGDVDSEDVLDTDRDGDIDGDDFSAADINNDGRITIDDVRAADQDGDGDVDADDIGDVDGDGDVDANDLRLADRDNDGDVDRADRGEGVDVFVKWKPDVENNTGSEFYIKYRPVGQEWWKTSPVEEKSLKQKIRGLDPYTAYELQMVAKDGEFETPSNITIIGPFAQSPAEEPTIGAVMDEADPMLMTWFIVAILVAVFMICIVFFSIWVYNKRLSRVSELRAQLYEGYEPPPVVGKKKDVEAATVDDKEAEEPLTADKQRQQMSALLKRQETVQSVDSFASHDDDFAEYGDETMGTTFNEDGSLIYHKE